MLDNLANCLTANAALLRLYVLAQQEHSCTDVSMSCSEPTSTGQRVVYFNGRTGGMNTLDTEVEAEINRCARIYWPDFVFKNELFDGDAPRFELLACLMVGKRVLALLALNKESGCYTISDVVASFQNCGYGATLVRATLAKIMCVSLQGAHGTERCVIFADPANALACRVYRSMGTPQVKTVWAAGVEGGDPRVEWLRFEFGSRQGAEAAMPSPPAAPILSWCGERPFDPASVDADVEEEEEVEASSSGGAGDNDDDDDDDEHTWQAGGCDDCSREDSSSGGADDNDDDDDGDDHTWQPGGCDDCSREDCTRGDAGTSSRRRRQRGLACGGRAAAPSKKPKP